MHAIRTHCLVFVVTLVLAACAGTPAFQRLADTHWQLVETDGHAVDRDAAVRTPYLLMHGDNERLEGHTGCNRINGAYSGGGRTLRFDSVASTRRFCANAMDQESAFMDALERTAGARVHDNTLTLVDRNDRQLARFTAQGAR